MHTIHATPATACQTLVDDAGTVTCARHPLVDTGADPWPLAVEQPGALCVVCVRALVPTPADASTERAHLCSACDIVDRTVARSIGQVCALVAEDVPSEHTRAEAARIVADLESRGVERIELDASGMTQWRDRVAPGWEVAAGPRFTLADWASAGASPEPTTPIPAAHPAATTLDRSVRAYQRLVRVHAPWVAEAQPLVLDDPCWVEAQHAAHLRTLVARPPASARAPIAASPGAPHRSGAPHHGSDARRMITVTPTSPCEALVDERGSVTCARHRVPSFAQQACAVWRTPGESLCLVCARSRSRSHHRAVLPPSALCERCEAVDATVARSLGERRLFDYWLGGPRRDRGLSARQRYDVELEAGSADNSDALLLAHAAAERGRVAAELAARPVDRVSVDRAALAVLGEPGAAPGLAAARDGGTPDDGVLPLDAWVDAAAPSRATSAAAYQRLVRDHFTWIAVMSPRVLADDAWLALDEKAPRVE